MQSRSDRNLVAQLRAEGDSSHCAVTLLLARHWRATCDYAIVCLASATGAAQFVATTAFNRVLGRLAGGAADGALRPQLLVAVRETVREWAADEGICVVLPELRKPTGGRGLRAAMPGPPERRQLAELAFRALPGASQCLLWHTEVEADPITIPAGLLGVDTATAAATLEQSREQFRAGLVRAHRELAPTSDCRFHNSLLDVPKRRGGSLAPDVPRHLTVCRYCRQAAEQLSHFEGRLEILLAEAVLGWGARRYLDSRPGRGAVEERPPAPEAVHPEAVHLENARLEAVPPGAGGGHRTTAGSRRRKALAVGVGLASLALLATVLVARSWSDENGVPRPGVTWGAPGGSRVGPAGPGTADKPSVVASPSAASASDPVEVAHGRLRSPATGLCLDVEGGRVGPGAGTALAACSSAESQQWSYQDDGRLRSAADPALCLAAAPEARTVQLSGCGVRAGEVSYGLTVSGELLLRRHKGLVVAPGSGRASTQVVVAKRDGTGKQRWVLDAGADQSERKAPGRGGPERLPPQPGPKKKAAPEPPGADTPREKSGQPRERYDTRIAQVGCCDDSGPAAGPPTPVDTADSSVLGALKPLPSRVTGTVTDNGPIPGPVLG
ncbi:ricin-type beta-trefoil lectin domain protein [Streptomyces sp. NPDC086549]|uniref:RICIN domain-containing protein n=1 Tax=Streptomyces sp. NPDC086549 TaxID=3365752 RepID=UPI00380666AE